MTKPETLEVMEVLRRAFPRFLSDPNEIAPTVDLWHEFVAPYPVEVCRYAAYRYIEHNKFAPSINELLDLVKETLNPVKDTPADAWNVLLKAASRASITTPEEFEALPYEIKRFCGSLNGLREFGRMDIDILNSVTRGQFMKTFDSMQSSRKAIEGMPDDVKRLVADMTKQMCTPVYLTEGDYGKS